MRKPDESDCFVIDGPVGLSAADYSSAESSAYLDANHLLEVEISRRLKAKQDVQFGNLVVRRCDDGVCLEGVVFTRADVETVGELLKDLTAFGKIHNRLTHHQNKADAESSVQLKAGHKAHTHESQTETPDVHAGVNSISRFFGIK